MNTVRTPNLKVSGAAITGYSDHPTSSFVIEMKCQLKISKYTLFLFMPYITKWLHIARKRYSKDERKIIFLLQISHRQSAWLDLVTYKISICRR